VVGFWSIFYRTIAVRLECVDNHGRPRTREPAVTELHTRQDFEPASQPAVTELHTRQDFGAASQPASLTVDEPLIAVITAGAQRFADSVRTELPVDPRIRAFAELTVSYLTAHRGRAIAE
jgi:hypothetical protein